MKRARYFYAPALFASNAKLFILTDTGDLYSSSQDKLHKVFLLESGVDFNAFQAWDINLENSPLLLEVTSKVVKSFIGKDYPKWWDALIEKGLLGERVMANAG